MQAESPVRASRDRNPLLEDDYGQQDESEQLNNELSDNQKRGEGKQILDL